MKFLVVDDNIHIVQIVKLLLESVGHQVEARLSSTQALHEASGIHPDVIILDLMMPEMDGFELCRRFRENPEMARVKIVILSGKTYDFDKRRARKLGADGYIVKPISHDTFIDELNAIISRKMKLTYWGTRGTLPVPGPDTLRYGGNTSCISIEMQGEPLLIMDAGSGIKKLSNYLMPDRRLTAKILVTHPHWDHINALPFFSPLYIRGNEIEIMGSPQGDVDFLHIISAQMDDVYFPVTMREFGACVYFRNLREESFNVGSFHISTMLLSHPGNCLGYRVDYENRSICYITDNELFPRNSKQYNEEFEPRLTEFVRGTDILIMDTTYLDQEYRSREGWGHSCVSEVVALAEKARVKSLHLFHHDPDQNDDAIDNKLAQACEQLSEIGSQVDCICPAEGSSYEI